MLEVYICEYLLIYDFMYVRLFVLSGDIMIYFNDDKIKEVSSWNDNSIYVLTDFDRTLTTYYSQTSINLLLYNENVPKELSLKCESLYEFYRPIELDLTMNIDTKRKHMIAWWKAVYNLFKEYRINESVLYNIFKNSNLELRRGTRSFLEEMNFRNIPVIIISAGLGNVIREFLLNCNLNFDNIYIYSNFLKIEDGIIVGVNDRFVHNLNKCEDGLPSDIKYHISKRENPILFGDLITDISMASEKNRSKALKVGFLGVSTCENLKHYLDNFDVVCTDDTGFDDVSKLIKVLK